MTSALLLAGGWAHPEADLVATISDLLSARQIDLRVITDPLEATTALEAAVEHGCDLLIVGCCWFSMADDRYSTQQRSEFAFEPDDAFVAALTSLRKSGCRLLALHTAVISFDDAPGWADWLGGSWNWNTSWHPAPAPMDVLPSPASPIDFASFSVVDELYQGVDVDSSADVVAQSPDGHPLVWLQPTNHGRVAVSLLGHDRRSLDHPANRALTNRLFDYLLAGSSVQQ